ncbi:MAG: hypothetical protein R3F28_00005, partial [Candidatus Kapaibacterium sp.]
MVKEFERAISEKWRQRLIEVIDSFGVEDLPDLEMRLSPEWSVVNTDCKDSDLCYVRSLSEYSSCGTLFVPAIFG